MRGIMVLALCSILMAGCSGPSLQSGDEVLVKSAPLVEVKSPDGAKALVSSEVASLPPSTRYGHLAGVVVDGSITPIEGAFVSIPGLDFTDKTERGGSFSFTDLVAGQYFIRADAEGFASAQHVVEVKGDEFTRVKFQLERLPPPTPKVQTQEFKGFADVTGDPVFAYPIFCKACEFEFYVQEHGLKAVVVDVVMDPYAGAGTGSNGFQYYLGPRGASYGEYYRQGEAGNPMQILLLNPELSNMSDPMELRAYPTSFPASEPNKQFTVHVTTWVNAVPPKGWKFGDPVPS